VVVDDDGTTCLVLSFVFSSAIPVLNLTPLAYLACPALVLPTSPELHRPRPVRARWWSIIVVVRSSLTMTGCGGGDGRGSGDDRRSRSRQWDRTSF
jgi:hypothetical protein